MIMSAGIIITAGWWVVYNIDQQLGFGWLEHTKSSSCLKARHHLIIFVSNDYGTWDTTMSLNTAKNLCTSSPLLP